MGDEVFSIPMPGAPPPPPSGASTSSKPVPLPSQEESWRIAQDSYKNTQKKPTQQAAQQPSMYSMYPWMHPNFDASSYQCNAYGSYQPPPAPTNQTLPQPPPNFGGGGVWNQNNQWSQNNQAVAYNYQQQNYQGYQKKNNWQQANKGNGWQGNQQNQWQQQQQEQQQKKPVQFSIGRGKVTPIGSSFVPAGSTIQMDQQYNPRGGFHGAGRGRGLPPGGPKQTPESVQRYIQRAFEAANSAEDRAKVQEYLKNRIQPMLDAGSADRVNWDREPLPHERNYEVPTMWIPAAQLNTTPQKDKQNKWDRQRRDTTESPDRKKRRSDSDMSNYGGNKEKANKQQKKKTKAEKKLEKQKKKQQEQTKAQRWKVDDSLSKREERARRFAESLQRASAPVVNVPIFRGRVIKGLCQDIEKSYFRLTSAPDPSQVRPLEVLKKSLENVKKKYCDRVEYRYLSSQLRSIRQDLTVQRIRNEFTVVVYEINARISLENKDREEFNQCQSQLKLLYSELGDEDCPHKAEFMSYRLLYYIAMENQIDINSFLQDLTPELEANDCIKFAMDVRSSVAQGNYVRLFKHFDNAPKMCAFIMDLFVERERRKALNIIAKSYRQTIPYSKIAQLIGLGEEDLVEWLVEDLEVKEATIGGSLDCRVARAF